MLAQVVVPQTRYDFKFSRKDFRILWALNCGSVSMPTSIFILTPENCERQLDIMLRYVYLHHGMYYCIELILFEYCLLV